MKSISDAFKKKNTLLSPAAASDLVQTLTSEIKFCSESALNIHFEAGSHHSRCDGKISALQANSEGKNPTVRLGVRALRHEELTYGRFLVSIIKRKLFIEENRHFPPPHELFEFAICA